MRTEREVIRSRGVGVFINAEYLVAAHESHRSPRALAERMTEATTRLMLTGGVAHRVIIGDCGDEGVRRLVEQFAETGFRVLHCPATASAPELLAAEIMEKIIFARDELMRAVVLGDSPERYRALTGSLCRVGISVITASPDGSSSHLGERSYEFNIAPGSLAGPTGKVIQERCGGNQAPAERVIPEFRPAPAGVETTAGLRWLHEHGGRLAFVEDQPVELSRARW
jgi:hypothetical protein